MTLFNGDDLSGWTPLTEDDYAYHGGVEVTDGTLRLGAGEPMTGIAWQGKFPRKQYEVSLNAMRTSGTDFFCGMTFPVHDSWCTLIIGGWGGYVVGLSNVDGFNASEGVESTGMNFESNRWYAIRLRVTEEAVQAWIDEELVIDQAIPDHEFDIWWTVEPCRPFGIATFRTGSALKDIKVVRLD